MRKQQSGHIINLASISGTVTGPSQATYSATKAAVIMMGEALVDEVAKMEQPPRRLYLGKPALMAL